LKVLVLSPGNKKMKNVVRDLVYGCWCGGRRIGGTQMPPLNLLYVATTLKTEGHDVVFVDAAIEQERYIKVLGRITDYTAVIILCSTNTFKTDVMFLQDIKTRNSGILSIVFGSHPTFMPEYCLKEECIDIAVRREPEFIIKDIINNISLGRDWRNIRGIGYRSNNKVILNDLYEFGDLDSLPIPDRGYLPKGLDYFNPVVKRLPYTTMQTSRGCPGTCTFCTVPSFYGRKIRARSAKKVFDEMKILRESGYKEIFFRDETFTVYKERNREICSMIIDNKIDVTWICNARINAISEDDIGLMKRAGCHMIKFGVESGEQFILDNIKKGIRLEQTRHVFRMCHELNMDTHAHVMLGCPGETVQSVENTIKFVKEIDPLTVSFGIHTPYPGTELFEMVARKHPEIRDGVEASIEKLHIKGFYNEYFTSIKRHDLEALLRKAYRSFYFRPGYITRRLLKMNGLDELMRWVIAGTNIFNFGLKRDGKS